MSLTFDNLYGPGETTPPVDTPNVAPEVHNPILDYAQQQQTTREAQNKSSSVGGETLSMHELLSKAPTDLSYKGLTPVKFNSKEEGFDKIYSSFKDDLYQRLGFIPGENNEQAYAQALGKAGQLGQGIKGILPIAFQAHNEGWKTEANFWGNLFKGNFAKAFSMTSDPKELQALYEASNKISDANFVPLTDEQKEGSFNVGKLSTGLQQFGFTLGTSVQFLEQSLIEWGAALLLAPETGTGSIWAELALTGRRAAKVADTIMDTSKAFSKIMRVEDQLFDAARIGKIWETLYAGTKNAIKPTNLYRFTKEYNMAAGEAKFEKAQSYGAFVEEAQDEFFRKYGREMTDEEMAPVQEQALKIANANGLTNTALLYFMNRMNMNNVLRTSFGMQKKLLAEAGEGIFTRTMAKKAAGEVTEEALDPFTTAAGIKTFSKDWFKGKGNSLSGWLADSAWEGVQELSQSVSSEYWKEYYTSRAKLSQESKKDWNKLFSIGTTALGNAIGKQNSTEGLDTFLAGFIIGVPGSMWNRSIGGIQNLMNKEAVSKQKEALQQRVDFLNSYANSPAKIFDRQEESYINQQELAASMEQAVKENNIYKYKNLNHKAFQEMVMGAYKAGKLEVLLDRMEKSLTNLGEEDFKEAFGLDKDVSSTKTANTMVAQMKEQAMDIAKTYDTATKQNANPFNPKQYKIGTEERKEEEFSYLAWEKILEEHTFQRSAQKDMIKRHREIMEKNSKLLGPAAYSSYQKMTSPAEVAKEIRILSKEVQALKANMDVSTPESRQALRDKENELDILKKWSEEISGKRIMETKIYGLRVQLFTDYLNKAQKKNGLPELEVAKVQEAFRDLKDIYKLDNDQKDTIINLNYLAMPENFKTLYEARKQALQLAHDEIVRLKEAKVEAEKAAAELLATPEGKEEFPEEAAALVAASVAGDGVAASEVLETVEEKIKEKTAPTPKATLPTAPELKVLKASSPLKVDQLLASINKAGILELDEMYDLIESPLYDKMKEKDKDLLYDAIKMRMSEINEALEAGNLAPDNPLWLETYKDFIRRIETTLKDPEVTREAIVSIYINSIIPHINRLGEEYRPELLSINQKDYNRILADIKKRVDSKDLALQTKKVTDILASSSEIDAIVRDVFFYIDSEVDASLAPKLIELVKTELSKKTTTVVDTSVEDELAKIASMDDLEKQKTAQIEFVMRKLAESVGGASAEKITEYAKRIQEGQDREKVIEGLSPSFVTAIDELLTASTIEAPFSTEETTPATPNILFEYINQEAAKVSGLDNTKPIQYNAPVSTELSGEEEESVYSALREKSEDDIRTTEDLIGWLEVPSTNQVSLKSALEKIAESDHATEYERILASSLARLLTPEQLLIINNSSPNSGYYEEGSMNVTINLNELGYTNDRPGYPVETVLLHEVLHLITAEALSDSTSQFSKDITALFRAAKNKVTTEKFYAFSKEAEEDQLHEFLVEAMTNPAFQTFLSKIEYSKSTKSLWDKFLTAIKNLLAQLNVSTTGSVLENVLVTTQEFIQDKTRKIDGESVVDIQKSIASAKTIEELNEAVDSIPDTLPRELISALQASAKRQRQKMNLLNKKELVKGLSKVKLGKKTYYYSKVDGIKFYEVRATRLNRVTNVVTTDKLVKELLKTKSIQTLLGKEIYNEIRSLGGDQKEGGTYASRNYEEYNVAERDYPAAFSEGTFYLNFNDKQEFYEFVRDYWNVQNGLDKNRELLGLKAKYGVGPVTNYGILANSLGGKYTARRNGRNVNVIRDKINKLIKKNVVIINGKRGLETAINETEGLDGELGDYLEYVLQGGTLSQTNINQINTDIAFWLKQGLGSTISPELQTELENIIFEEPWTEKEEEFVPTPVPTESVIFVQHDSFYGGISAEDFSLGQTESVRVRSSRNNKTLRSTSRDVISTGEGLDSVNVESEEFKQFYYKIRNIINKLYENKTYGNYRITVTRDNQKLRWDGSTGTDSVIGIITDLEGNPVVFNENGNRVDVLSGLDYTSDKELNNGSNQIVYFRLPNPDNLRTITGKNAPKKESIDELENIINTVLSGKNLIGTLDNIQAGKHNLKELVNPKTVDKISNQTNIAENIEFQNQLKQDHVSLTLASTGKLNIVVTDSTGTKTYTGVFPPDSNKVLFMYEDESARNLPQHLIRLMRAYHIMSLNKTMTPEIQEKLLTFVRKIYYTGGDKRIKVSSDFKTITCNVNSKDESGKDIWIPVTFNIVTNVSGGRVNMADTKTIDKVVSFLGGQPLNIDKKWLAEDPSNSTFNVPFITTVEGQEFIGFQNLDYTKFLIEDAGLKTNITEIPAQENLKRYNSIIEFSDLVEIKPKEVVIVSEEEVLEGTREKTVEDVKTLEPDITAPKIKKKKITFEAPAYPVILEKTCR